MKRASTPYHEFPTNVDLTDAKVRITYSQRGRVIVNKEGKDVEVNGNIASCHLTQKETLRFVADVPVKVQLRYVRYDGTSDSTDEVEIEDILKDGEMHYED